MHTFYQPHDSEYRWTTDHPLSQVRGNLSKTVQTRRQLATDPEMYMFALTVSTTESKTIKEAMDDSAWIDAMQEELHQFDRLQVWELVDKPFGKTVIKLKWLWKNKKDEDQTGEYDMWRLRIEQYFQVQDYALWDVIENGNSFKPAAQTTTNADGTSTTLIPGPVTTEEKAQKKNDVKARSMLLMALPNEHLMTFNQYKDAKTLFAAIQTRFGGNEATKKTQKTLLKQMYENFSAPSTESLDSIFNRLQKIVSQLAILGENISQEDLNLKFLRSLPSEWNTHVVVWRNKPDLDTMSFDDLYNNFKIVEQEVKGTASLSSSSSSQNVAFVSSSSSTNEVNTAYGVSTANTQVSPASTQVSTASTQVSTANLCDDIVYAFLASQPNGSQLVHEDLEQIHEDDLKKIDLKWQLALLSMRTRRFFQKTGRKITINGSDTAGYDKNQDSSRRTINVEETSSKAMLAIDGAGFDWSYMADDEVPTNMALMAFSDSKVHNDKTCSKTCLKSFETLKTQLDDLRIEFNKFEFNLANYKRGLASVEEQLVFYKKNEVIFCEQLAVLKRDISYKDSEICMLKSELEKLKQEKESNQLKIENFDNASKSLDKLIGSQILDKSRKGLGFVSYNAVPPPLTGLFSPPNLDLSNSGLEEFQQPEFEGYGPKTSKNVSEDTSNEVRESPDAPMVEELVSNDKKKTIHQSPSGIFINQAKYALEILKNMLDVKVARLHCNVIGRSRVRGVICKLCSTNVDEDTTSRLWLQLQQNTVVLRLSVSHSNFMQPRVELPYQAHPYSISFHKGTGFGILSDELVLLKVPRKNNMYSVDMKNIVPKESLTCLVAKATLDESMLWHRRLASKDETSGILKSFITEIENLVDKKVKIIRCDNGTEFKNRVMSEFCEKKGIKREFSVARTPQQNGVAERRNRTLIEAARTMLADSKLPTKFWAEAVKLPFAFCYWQNRVLVVKPHNKTPYELFRGRTPALSFMRPFRCHVTILNTLDHLGKFFVGYSMNSDGPKWLFNIDVLTKSMNYVSVVAGTNSNDFVGTKESIGAGHSSKETRSSQDCILMPLWKDGSLFDSSSKNASNDEP
ncbi:ribonuclease H-like domain-containing protein [Tanacetum coccineum]